MFKFYQLGVAKQMLPFLKGYKKGQYIRRLFKFFLTQIWLIKIPVQNNDSLGIKCISMDILINYLVEWKQALFEVHEKFSFPEVYGRLKTAGMKKNYSTIRTCFKGLVIGPRESAIHSIIDPNINLGSRDANDIQIFGKDLDFQGY